MQTDSYEDQHNLKQQAAEVVGLSCKHINVAISDAIRTPVSYGICRKTILLPQDYRSRYSLTELYLLLLHEMTHLKNHDTVKLQFIAYSESFIWTLPLMVSFFKRDTEILCDNRVIGLQSNERNTYEKLLLKESTNKSTIKGFAFSDSYRVISSRLNALQVYGPEKSKFAFFSAVIFAVLLLALGWSYRYPARWLDWNDDYMSDYMIRVIYDYGSYRTSSESVKISQCGLQPDGAGVYEVIEGKIYIDKLALYKEVLQLEKEDAVILEVDVQSVNYTMAFVGDIQYVLKSMITLTIDDLASADESDRYFIQPVQKRGVRDQIYFIAARWF